MAKGAREESNNMFGDGYYSDVGDKGGGPCSDVCVGGGSDAAGGKGDAR